MSSIPDLYLARLGLEAEPPSVDALFRMHRAHAERVPWETLWIHLGEPWGLDVDESMTRIATTRRGGYCFHLNGAFGELLSGLGYHVVRHVGGVHGPATTTEAEMSNHLVLTVHDLRTDANPDGVWYVDAGLGDALHEPLPLIAAPYRQEPFQLALERTPGAIGDWHLTHDPAGSFVGMSWWSAPTGMDAFADRHAWFTTSPDSGFARTLVVQLRDATGVDVLKGLTLKRVGTGAAEETIANEAGLIAALGDVFALDVARIGSDTRRALWARARAAHEAREAERS